jgi:hypothetical protein
MQEITLGEHPAFQVPILEFRGTPTGIDVARVVRTRILPQINTGMARLSPARARSAPALSTRRRDASPPHWQRWRKPCRIGSEWPGCQQGERCSPADLPRVPFSIRGRERASTAVIRFAWNAVIRAKPCRPRRFHRHRPRPEPTVVRAGRPAGARSADVGSSATSPTSGPTPIASPARHQAISGKASRLCHHRQ